MAPTAHCLAQIAQGVMCGIVFVTVGALMESESINMEGSVEVTLASN